MTLYRKVVWFYKGTCSYTRAGYEKASKEFAAEDLNVDCTGKVFLITGANSGIGKCVAAAVAQRGGTVHMVCRNQASAESAKEELQKLTNNENIHIHLLDLSQPKSVFQFASEFVNTHNRLDVLVNNAGCMVPRVVDSNGFEFNFATNSLAPFILMKLLQPLLERSEHPRVVNVSSGGMLTQKLNFDDPQLSKVEDFDPTSAYAQHKRQQVVMTEVAAKENSKIFHAVMHPGWADTPAVRSAMPEFHAKMKDKLRTAEEGADTVVWLSISPAAGKYPSGLFFEDRKPISTHLPLAWTRTSVEEDQQFVGKLDQYLAQCNQ